MCAISLIEAQEEFKPSKLAGTSAACCYFSLPCSVARLLCRSLACWLTNNLQYISFVLLNSALIHSISVVPSSVLLAAIRLLSSLVKTYDGSSLSEAPRSFTDFLLLLLLLPLFLNLLVTALDKLATSSSTCATSAPSTLSICCVASFRKHSLRRSPQSANFLITPSCLGVSRTRHLRAVLIPREGRRVFHISIFPCFTRETAR